MTIKFQKYYVTDGATKVRCWYMLDSRRKCVTLFAKDYGNTLGMIFPEECSNGTDIMTDYFEKDRVVFFEDHPLYPAARARAELNLS